MAGIDEATIQSVLARQKKSSYSEPRALRRKLEKACDRKQDGDLEEHTLPVPQHIQDIPGVSENEIKFVFQNPVCAMAEVLCDPSIAFRETVSTRAEAYTGYYNEWATGNAARHLDRVLKPDAAKNQAVLPMLLHADGVAVGYRGASSLKPITVAPLNLSSASVRSDAGRVTIGFWPSLTATKSAKEKGITRAWLRQLYHWAVSCLTKSIEKYRDGIILDILGARYTFFPVLALIPSDWPEGQKLSNMFEGAANSQRNCRVCRHPTTSFSVTQFGLTHPRRTDRETRAQVEKYNREVYAGSKAVKSTQEREDSAYHEHNGLWDTEMYSNKYGIHALLPMDTLHTIPLGIITVLKDALLLLSKGESRVVLDSRLRDMPLARDEVGRGLYFRSFKTGVEGIGKFTADDFIALLQQLPFVVGYGDAVISDRAKRDCFLEACVHTRTMLIVSKMDSVNEVALSRFHLAAKAIGPLLQKLYNYVDGKIQCADRPKVHGLLHFRYFARRYGSLRNTCTSTFERNHQLSVIRPVERDCNRKAGREERMMRAVDARACLTYVLDADVPDPVNRRQSLTLRSLRTTEQRGTLLGATTVRSLVDAPGTTLGGGRNGIFSRVLARSHAFGGEDEKMKDALGMQVYDVLSVDHGEDRTLYAASPRYRKGDSRNDVVNVLWGGGWAPSPAKLVAFFGTPEKALWFKDSNESCDMYALVQTMERTPNPPAQFSFVGVTRYRFANPGSSSSYEIITLDSILGHAHLIPDWDSGNAGYFWLDTIDPEELLNPIVDPKVSNRKKRRGGVLKSDCSTIS